MSRSGPSADEVDAHVGRRLRQRRISLGITQEQLGTEFGLTFQQIQKYEKGQNRISAGRLYELSEILSVDVGFFFEGLSRRSGKAPGEVEAQALFASPEGLALAAGFMRISDPATRRRVIDLVSTIGGDGT